MRKPYKPQISIFIMNKRVLAIVFLAVAVIGVIFFANFRGEKNESPGDKIPQEIPSPANFECGDGQCELGEGCWKDCKPVFNSMNIEGTYRCDSGNTPECCASGKDYAVLAGYYSCDFSKRGCEAGLSFCSALCNARGYEGESAEVESYKIDLETGNPSEEASYIKCSCKRCLS